MANVSAQNGTNGLPAAGVKSEGLWSQLMTMRRIYTRSPVFRTLLLISAGSFLVVVATALGQIVLNRWNQPFYDAIERRNVDAFFYQLKIFAAIAGGMLVFNILQQWLNQRFRLKLREGLTRDLICEWMRPRRAFRLANAGAIGVNPDQRMQEDAGHLADLTTDLAFGLLQSSILLVSFVGVLWSLSEGFMFEIGGRTIDIPGYMVWAAIIYAGSASLLSWRVGRPLIELNGERYNREAALRFTMMRVNEHIDSIALAGGETGERQKLDNDLGSVLTALRNIFRAQINLAWVVDGYGWVTVVAPILVAAPVYFSGHISFGGLMMAVGAFNQVHSSLRWFVANIGAITDWRATLHRITSFRSALIATDALNDAEGHIEFVLNDSNRLTLDRLDVASPSGRTHFDEPHIEIGAGERVVITGEPRTGKTLLFRALAGLWPLGSGRVGLPKGEAITFLPRTPYMPPGRLRDVLSYPQTDTFTDTQLIEALARVGLQRMAPLLDTEARWDRELSDDDERLLAFARALLHKPHWLVLDEVLETMDPTTLRRVLSILETELQGSTVVSLGRVLPDKALFTREIRLVREAKPQSRQPARPDRSLEGAQA
ncbi:ABC transporter ATP-binding protein/permease [Mycoplana rhizolycopersici]|uniref:ABC transporter ATP-binding protein/permease n=1 Tax=Mycoplana rhizolycopersici TaxID=2746702 RepID=A0ABX2QKT8_9HYPH|nr:ABC transporter ATP-binding protein/permease [Rhizobium rhizolycopersici]NVP57183.1 ABC transporter ATP-binding protein/permease [Rhizobium rhizolycopersici]